MILVHDDALSDVIRRANEGYDRVLSVLHEECARPLRDHRSATDPIAAIMRSMEAKSEDALRLRRMRP